MTSAQGAVLRLLAILVVGVVAAIALHAVNVLVVVLAIVAMIMLHELAHFLVAKASGMKVTEYFLGFGPRLWSVRKGETEYGIKAIPAGGYVRIPGMTMLEEVDAVDELRSYRQASFPRRVAVSVAGSAMHFVIAIALCWYVLAAYGTIVGTRPYVEGMLRFVGQSTPAAKAGLRNGDLFVSIDNHPVTSFASFEDVVRGNVGKALPVVVERGHHLVHLTVTPVSDRGLTEEAGHTRIHTTGAPHGVIGVELSSGRRQSVPVGNAAVRSFGLIGTFTTGTFQSLGDLFSFHGISQFVHTVTTAAGSSGGGRGSGASGGGSASGNSGGQVESILGVIEIGSQAASQDIELLLLLLAEVNVFIGLINLIPMLPFDGGHVAIAVYERIRSRKGRRYHADVLKLLPVAYVFLALVVLMGLGELYVNIVHPAHLPPG